MMIDKYRISRRVGGRKITVSSMFRINWSETYAHSQSSTHRRTLRRGIVKEWGECRTGECFELFRSIRQAKLTAS